MNRYSYKFNFIFDSEVKETEDFKVDVQEKIKVELIETIDESLEISTVSQKCLEYLKKKEVVSVEEIAKYYNLDEKIIATVLARLTKSNKAIRVGRGKYALKKEGTKDIKDKLVPGNDEKIPF